MPSFLRPGIFRVVVAAGLLLALGESGWANPRIAAPREKTNILLITVDTLRADHLGVYGYSRIRTPNIDRLGKSGVLFSRAFSHVPLTLPSHCSILTGTLPLLHGVRDNGYRLPNTVPTLAEILKAEGYRTAAFVGAFPLDSRFGLSRGFDTYDDLYGSRNVIRDLSFVERKADDVNKKAFAWLEANQRDAFFVWIHYFDPHAPYEPPEPFNQEYRGREYDGEIAYTDAAIGRLLGEMEKLDLLGRTLVVLTADHGESLGEHKEATHGIFVYDATLHVPLVFSGSKISPPGRTVQAQVGLIDIAPTVLDFVEKPPGRLMQGRSLVRLMRRDEALSETPCYVESVAAMLDRNWAPLQGLRMGDWKFIEAPDPELYDLETDPSESQNVIAKFPERRDRMKEALRALIRKESPPASAAAAQDARDEETRKKLMSLGYLAGKASGSPKERPDPKTMIDMDNLFNDAIIASETGDLERAERLYRDVLARQPDFIVGYEYAAYNLYKMGQLKAAVSLLKKAASANLTTVSLVSRLGLYEQEAGSLDESVRTLEKAVGLDANYAEAYNYLGVSYFKSGRVKDASAAFQKAIALDPDYSMATNNLGNCWLALEDYDAAARTYEKAISADPGLASAQNGLGAALYRKGQIADAVARWETSLELDPKQPDTLYNLGRAYLRLNLKKEALKLFEAFLAVAPPQKYQKDIDEVRGVIERLKKEIGEKGSR